MAFSYFRGVRNKQHRKTTTTKNLQYKNNDTMTYATFVCVYDLTISIKTNQTLFQKHVSEIMYGMKHRKWEDHHKLSDYLRPYFRFKLLLDHRRLWDHQIPLNHQFLRGFYVYLEWTLKLFRRKFWDHQIRGRAHIT